jgi:hypothetical protein
VVVDDLNVFGCAIDPSEAEPVLVIDPDAELAEPITLQGLEPIPWNDPEVA